MGYLVVFSLVIYNKYELFYLTTARYRRPSLMVSAMQTFLHVVMWGNLRRYLSPAAGTLVMTWHVATGTNMLISARAAFDVGHYGEQAGLNTSTHRGRPTQIFSEEQTSEDVLLGSRLHAGGYKGVFLRENLATGEVCFPSALENDTTA